MTNINRRELLTTSAGVLVASAFTRDGEARQAPAAPGASPFFPGLTVSKVKTTGAEIHVVKGGQGPPLLLIHGAPQTHITWRRPERRSPARCRRCGAHVARSAGCSMS